jgi:RNA polymerase sigma factor (sigma-70 family)
LRSQLRYELRLKQLINDTPEANNLLSELEARFAQTLIDEAIDQLPAKRKQVFLMSRRDGLSRKEIAAQLNISENTVRNQLADAIEFIRSFLHRNGSFVIPAVILLPNI